MSRRKIYINNVLLILLITASSWKITLGRKHHLDLKVNNCVVNAEVYNQFLYMLLFFLG